MFSNLTQREKILAAIVGSLAPVVVLFLLAMSFINTYNERKTRIAGLNNSINAEFQKRLDATQSNVRRNFHYKLKSLPSADNQAIVEYRDWLEDIIRDNGLRFVSIKNPEKTEIKYRGTGSAVGVSKVANKFEYTFSSSGTLDQIMNFVYDFERVELLQKIKQLTIRPKKERDILTGKHGVTFKIEVVSLVDADEQRDFLATSQELPVTIDQYKESILTRNVFGPANNPPTMSLSRKSFYPDDDISIPLSGRDNDEADELTYEIVDAGELKDATIEQKEGSNRAKLVCPPQELGEYEIKVRVSDNGFPPKSYETNCKITIKERPPKREEKVKEEPPPFLHVGQTQIKRISSRDGIFEVKIAVRTTGEVFELKQGETFELDGSTWKVVDIGVHSMTVEVDDKRLKFDQGAFLDKPSSEEPIK